MHFTKHLIIAFVVANACKSDPPRASVGRSPSRSAPPVATPSAEAPPAPPTTTAPTTPPFTAASLEFRVGAATVFRDAEGQWITRAAYTVRNTGAQPIELDRASFKATGATVSAAASTLPERATLAPGQSTTGDLAWTLQGDAPAPMMFRVRYQPGDDNAQVLTTIDYPLTLSPAPPAPGTAPNHVVFALPVTTPGEGLTFVHGDGNRYVRIPVRVQNTTDVVLRIPRGYFHARIGTVEGTLSSERALTSFGDEISLAAGETFTGTVGFSWRGALGTALSAVQLSFGAPRNAQAEIEAAVSAGASVLP
jgi:hypothetical protein